MAFHARALQLAFAAEGEDVVADDVFAAVMLMVSAGAGVVDSERKGNKAGALGIGGNAFVGQNLSWYNGPSGSISFTRAAGSLTLDSQVSYPHQWGGWFQFDYWFTNAFSFHGWYSHAKNNISSRGSLYNLVNANTPKQNQQYIVNLSYDVNPALRFGIEYAHIRTKYANYTRATIDDVPTIIADKKSTLNTIRIGAWYFF